MNMLRPRSAWYGIMLVMVAALAWSAPAWSADDPSGMPADYRVVPVARPEAPSGLSDMMQAIRTPAVAATPRAATTDLDKLPPPSWSSVALWERLTALSPSQRENAAIEVELGGRAGAADRLAASQVQALWSEGRYDEAIVALRSFEVGGGKAALGIAWKKPVALAGRVSTAGALATTAGGTDVRIGTRTGGHLSALDYDATSGAMYAVIAWTGTTSGDAWAVYRSTSDGASWSETYIWYAGSSNTLVDMSATVVGGYVYVGYVPSDYPEEYRLRRCLASTGAVDSGYGYVVVVDAGALTIREVTVVSNAMSSDNRLYCLAIQSDNAVRFFWAVASTATSFTENSPAGASATTSLDASWNPGYATQYLHVCYAGTDGDMHVQRLGTSGWDDTPLLTTTGVHRHGGSISCYNDVVICAYEHLMDHGQGIAYAISYDGGVSDWDFYNYIFEPAEGEGPYQCPDVDTHNGIGCAIIASHEEGEPDAVYCRKRAVFAPGLWEDQWKFNDNDVLTGTQTTLAHVPVLGPTCFSLGAIYFNNTTPYFDLPMLGTTDVPDSRVATGVQLLPPTPNPFAERATVRFTLPVAGPARLEVFDLRGGRVATLADGPLEAGTHSFSLEGRGLGSGVYFCRLTAGPAQKTNRLVVIH